MKIDKEAIRELAELLKETGLTEIEVSDDDNKVRVSRASGVANYTAAAPNFVVDAGQSGTPAAVAAPAGKAVGTITSPMVGTVYLAPEPSAEPYAAVGKTVKAGDTLVIIEAMKVMNAIKAEKSGVVQQVLVTDGQPVEFGDPLIVIA